MVRGRRDFSFGTALELMDQGILKRVAGGVTNGLITLYTVPAGKKFYVFSACLNVEHNAAGSHTGFLRAYDGVTGYNLLYLEGPDAADQMNEAVGFTVMSIDTGWTIQVLANVASSAYGCVVGVEVVA